MKPTQEKEEFLSNPDSVHYQIICFSCRAPLWETKILKRVGTHVISTETHACDPRVKKFDKYQKQCGLCTKPFYQVTSNGGHLYMIKCLNSMITRLI